jgi:hypothetical protein
VLQVGNKPALLGLRKLIRSSTTHGKADHNFATVLFRVREPGRVAATCDVCLGLVGELGG